MRMMTRCPKCRHQYDTNTIYGGCPYCLRRQLSRVPRCIREAEQDAHHSAVWDGIMKGAPAKQ